MAWRYKIKLNLLKDIAKFYKDRSGQGSSYKSPTLSYDIEMNFPVRLTLTDRATLQTTANVVSITEERIS